MQQEYTLEKWIWNHEDFDRMGWHDCCIYAIQFGEKICFDIDYIFKWNKADREGLPFTYWIAPATLVFDQPQYVKVSLETMVGNQFCNGMHINDMTKGKSKENMTLWKIDTEEGDIDIETETYTQVIRRAPSFQYSQCIEQVERGGISFSTEPNETFGYDQSVINRRAEDDANYKLVLQKADFKIKRNQLSKDSMGLKDYLTQKRELDQNIKLINESLKNTRFEFWGERK